MVGFFKEIETKFIERSDDDVATWIDRMRAKKRATALVPLLRHEHAVYKQRSSNAVIRIRGYLMAAFAQTGMPHKAIAAFLDELDTSNSPYVIAGAAIGLRGVKHPNTTLIHALLQTVQRMQYDDDTVCFEQFKPDWQNNHGRSALEELLHTIEMFSEVLPISQAVLQQLTTETRLSTQNQMIVQRIMALQKAKHNAPIAAINSDCCTFPTVRKRQFINVNYSFSNIKVQDQNGEFYKLSELMKARPSLLTFFYTRCDNVYRCSLTMTRLGRLQTVLKTEGITQKVQLLAVSFDGAFDLPFRMEAFAQRRGFALHEQAKCLRVVSGMSHLLGCLQPGVNFNNGLVNQHTVNFFMFDKFGVIKQQISSLEWEAKQVSKSFKKILNQKETPYTKLRHKWSTGVSIGYAILIAFFPKCPLCVAAYLSALGISSTSVLQYHRILLPVLILLLSWHLHAVFRRAKQRRWYLPLGCSLLGGCIVIWTVFKVSANWLSICGILLITIGAVLNSWDVIPSRFYTLARGMAYPRWTSSLSLKRKL